MSSVHFMRDQHYSMCGRMVRSHFGVRFDANAFRKDPDRCLACSAAVESRNRKAKRAARAKGGG